MNDALINQLRMIQRDGDDYLHQLRNAHVRTNHKSLWWNLLVWFPLLQIVGFVNLLKWAKELPVTQVCLMAFGSIIFGVKVSEVKGVDTIQHLLEKWSLANLDMGVYGLVFFVVWYTVTLFKLYRQVTDPSNPYFLYAAYRKFDATYKVFGPKVEAVSCENFFDLIATKLEAADEANVAAKENLNEFISVYNTMEEQKGMLTSELITKRRLLREWISIAKSLSETIVEHEEVHYKHLDFMDAPILVYQKQGNELVRKWSDGVLSYDKKISLTRKTNFFVKVHRSKRTGEFVKHGEMIALCVNARNKDYVVSYKVDKEDQKFYEQHQITSREFAEVIKAILMQIK